MTYQVLVRPVAEEGEPKVILVDADTCDIVSFVVDSGRKPYAWEFSKYIKATRANGYTLTVPVAAFFWSDVIRITTKENCK